ncbi:hypothetical protein DBR42_25085, partial [Pelomonas sp. HMWF004]
MSLSLTPSMRPPRVGADLNNSPTGTPACTLMRLAVMRRKPPEVSLPKVRPAAPSRTVQSLMSMSSLGRATRRPSASRPAFRH